VAPVERIPLVPPFGIAAAFALVAGVALCLCLPALPSGAWLVAALAIGAWLWSRRDAWRLAGVLLAGFGIAGLHAGASLAGQLPLAMEGQDAVVSGRVVDLPLHEARRTRFLFRVDDDTALPAALRGKTLRLSWYDDFGAAPSPDAPRYRLAPGSRWRLQARLRAPRGLRNPGSLDSEKHAFAQRIAATGYVRSPQEAQRLSEASGIDAWRDAVAGRIDDAVDSDSSRYVRALALGDTRALSEGDWEALRATGLTHLIAISGFHVGLVAGFCALLAAGLWWLLPRLGRTVPRPQAAALGALLGAAGYAAVAGFALPTVRTVLMVAVVVAARLWRRPVGVPGALALAAIAVLLFDPLALLAAGFWLSFAGVAWLAWCLPHARGGRRIVGEFLSAQGVATLGLLPLTAILFGQASLAGPLANLVAIPWWSLVVVPLSLVGTALEALHAGWGGGAWRLAAACFDLSWPVFQRMADSPLSLWWLPESRGWALPLALVGAFWCLLPGGVPGKPLALLLWLPLLWPDRGLPAHGEAELVVIDVGQGLSVLVRTRHHALLYDMGPAVPDGYDAGERTVVPTLHALGVRKVEAAVVSHGDADHAGGYPAVARRFPSAATYAPEGAGLDGARTCVAGQAWRRDGVRFRFLHPPRHFPYLRNEASCVLRIETAHGAALLTGDIGEAIEQGLVTRHGEAVRADVVLAAHHGSRHSSTPAFVAATGARLALVSAGHGNRFGHPHPAVAARWREAGAELLSTPESGALRIRLQHGGIHASEQRATHRRLWDAAHRQARLAGGAGGLSYGPYRSGHGRGMTRAGTGEGGGLADDPAAAALGAGPGDHRRTLLDAAP
jgi:competence protein ComEC